MTPTRPEPGSAVTPAPVATEAAATEGGTTSRRGARHEPSAPRSCLGTTLALLVAAVSVVYLVNPGLGVLELLPDNLPVVGNLDEAFFTAALLSALGYLGLRLPFSANARR